MAQPLLVTGSDGHGDSPAPAEAAADLLARAEVLTGDGELIAAAEDVLHGAEQAGADPRCVRGLLGALEVLDPGTRYGYDAGASDDQRANAGFASEWEFLQAVSDLEDDVTVRRREAAGLLATAMGVLEEARSGDQEARDDLAAARDALSAAYAMPIAEPCDGCHAAKQAAISDAGEAEQDAETRLAASGQVIASAEAAVAVLEPYAAALVIVLARVRRVPADLGETYELVHEFIRAGGKLPPSARFIQGTTMRR